MAHDPTDLTLDDATREEAGRKAARDAKLAIDDLRWVMSNKRGRRFVYRLLEQSRVFQLSFVYGDPHATSFNEGLRNVGLQTFVELHEHAPESYALMLSEHHHARSSDA